MREKRQGGAGLGLRLTTGLVLLALVMVSVNLRPAITTIAGVMNQVPVVFGLDAALLPLLGTLPVLAFGVSGPIGPWLARRLGTGRAVALALVVLALALIVRVMVPALLLPGTFLAGMAIMSASVLIPQIVKANRGTGWWTGLCTMGFGLGAALGAGLVQPLQHLLGGSLPWALAVWALPALLGALLIQRSGSATAAGSTAAGSSTPGANVAGTTAAGTPAEGANRAAAGDTASSAVTTKPGNTEPVLTEPALPLAPELPLRKQRTAWAVTAFFGLQAMLYFAITSWLAVYLVSRGIPAAESAALLAWFSLAGLPASLLAPVLAGRPGILRFMAPGLGLSVALALVGVLAAPAEMQFLMVGILGVVQSAGFGLAMALVVIRTAGPQSAGRLSAMSQGIGFAVASLGPLGAGLLHTMTGGWEVTFLALAAEAVVLAIAGFLAIRGPLVSVGRAPAPADLASKHSLVR